MILWKLLVLLNVLKNFLILILIKSSLDSWIFESWILILIILESWNQIYSWSLKCSHSWMSSSLLSWSDLDFWAFCHHLCYHQNSLNQSLFIMKLASTKTNTRFILVLPQTVPTSSPQETYGPWDFFQPCKNLYKQRSTRDVPSLVLFEQPSGCTLHLNWSTRDVPSLVLSITIPK